MDRANGSTALAPSPSEVPGLDISLKVDEWDRDRACSKRLARWEDPLPWELSLDELGVELINDAGAVRESVVQSSTGVFSSDARPTAAIG